MPRDEAAQAPVTFLHLGSRLRLRVAEPEGLTDAQAVDSSDELPWIVEAVEQAVPRT